VPEGQSIALHLSLIDLIQASKPLCLLIPSPIPSKPYQFYLFLKIKGISGAFGARKEKNRSSTLESYLSH